MRVGAASPDYFKTLGIRIVRGRAIGSRDCAGAPQVMMVNETAARKFFPGEEPLGRRIELGMKSGGVPQGGEIVGVVADVKQDALEAKIDPQLFLPYDQLPMESVAFVVRSAARTPRRWPRRSRGRCAPSTPTSRSMDCSRWPSWSRSSTSQSRFHMLLLGDPRRSPSCSPRWGSLRRDRLRRPPAHPGDRHPHGARRLRDRGAAHGGRPGEWRSPSPAPRPGSPARSSPHPRPAQPSSTRSAPAIRRPSSPCRAVLLAVAALGLYLPARRAALTEPQLALKGEG